MLITGRRCCEIVCFKDSKISESNVKFSEIAFPFKIMIKITDFLKIFCLVILYVLLVPKHNKETKTTKSILAFTP